MNTKKQKMISVFLCIVFMCITIVSLFYISEERNHICTGDDCPICVCVHQAEQMLKNIGNNMCIADMLIPLNMIVWEVAVLYIFVVCITLVAQKVRIND